MTNKIKVDFINEAIRIGDELLLSASETKNEISWKSMNVDNDRKIIWKENVTLYSGVPGITLFFMELFLQTNNKKYFIAAKKGLNWSIKNLEMTNIYDTGFITSNSGIILALTRMYDITKEEQYLQFALNVAMKISEMKTPLKIHDYISGNAGIIFILTILHSYTKEDFLLELIDIYLKYLLNNMKMSKKGLYWDHYPDNIDGLCGFAHGVSGIGYVFLQLGHYFSNDTYYWLADQAFLHEAAYFDKGINNWGDLRLFKNNDEDLKKQKKAFLRKNFKAFTKYSDMNAWCHGAAGIGMARLLAYQLTGNKKYKKELNNALRKTIQTDIENKKKYVRFITCHGKSGNADLFIEAFRFFNNKKYLEYAGKSLHSILKRKLSGYIYDSGFGFRGAKGNEDVSLFMGNAGIGYQYLKFLQPLRVPSILMPKINASMNNKSISSYKNISLTVYELLKRMVSTFFPRTSGIVNELLPDRFEAWLNKSLNIYNFDFKKEFRRFINSEYRISNIDNRKVIKDIFLLEFKKNKQREEVKSFAYLNIKEIMLDEVKRIHLEHDLVKFMKLKFKVNSDVITHKTIYNWTTDTYDNENKKIPSRYHIILMPESSGFVAEMLISEINFYFLKVFETTKSVRSAMEDVLKLFGKISVQQKMFLKEQFISQTKEFVNARILT